MCAPAAGYYSYSGLGGADAAGAGRYGGGIGIGEGSDIKDPVKPYPVYLETASSNRYYANCYGVYFVKRCLLPNSLKASVIIIVPGGT
jgi:hypothetical protein